MSPRSRFSAVNSLPCQNGHRVINHDWTTKLTLQTKYDSTLPAGYPKVAYPLEISSWIWNLFTHGQTLPGRFAIGSETIDHRFDVVYHDVITGSHQSHDHHYDAPLIHKILKYSLPQKNIFFIATASVVKDAADNPDCQGLRTMVLFAILRAPHYAAYCILSIQNVLFLTVYYPTQVIAEGIYYLLFTTIQIHMTCQNFLNIARDSKDSSNDSSCKTTIYLSQLSLPRMQVAVASLSMVLKYMVNLQKQKWFVIVKTQMDAGSP